MTLNDVNRMASEYLNDCESTFEMEELFELAKKGLVLDKIRAEIMKLQTYKMFGGEDTVYVEHEDVLAIIDKYKAEIEPQERSGEE